MMIIGASIYYYYYYSTGGTLWGGGLGDLQAICAGAGSYAWVIILQEARTWFAPVARAINPEYDPVVSSGGDLAR